MPEQSSALKCTPRGHRIDRVDVGEYFVRIKHAPVVRGIYEKHLRNPDDGTGHLLWPGALTLARYLLSNSELIKGKQVAELGAGVGLTGLVSANVAKKVVLTDRNDEVLDILRENIELNYGFQSGIDRRSEFGKKLSIPAEAAKLDWKESVSQFLIMYPKKFDVIIGAEVIYSAEHVRPLLQTVKALLSHRNPDAKFLLYYVVRDTTIVPTIESTAKAFGFTIEEINEKYLCHEGTETPSKHYLFLLRRKCMSSKEHLRCIEEELAKIPASSYQAYLLERDMEFVRSKRAAKKSNQSPQKKISSP